MSQRNRQIVRNFRQLPVKCQVIAEKAKKAKNIRVLLMILLPIQQRSGGV
jgi:hypothetical protein